MIVEGTLRTIDDSVTRLSQHLEGLAQMKGALTHLLADTDSQVRSEGLLAFSHLWECQVKLIEAQHHLENAMSRMGAVEV